MDIQTEKLLVIEQVLRINDQAVLDRLLQWLLATPENTNSDVVPLPPLTDADFIVQMRQSVQEMQADETVSNDEVTRLTQEWRRQA
jgi:aminopeptidase C